MREQELLIQRVTSGEFNSKLETIAYACVIESNRRFGETNTHQVEIPTDLLQAFLPETWSKDRAVLLALKRMGLMLEAAIVTGPNKTAILRDSALLDAFGWLGYAVWRLAGQKKMTDMAVKFLALALLDRMSKCEDPDLDLAAKRMQQLIADAVYTTVLISAVSWARSGFSRVRSEPRILSSLAFTGLPNDLNSFDVRVPWDAFVLELPEGFIPFDNTGTESHAHAVTNDVTMQWTGSVERAFFSIVHGWEGDYWQTTMNVGGMMIRNSGALNTDAPGGQFVDLLSACNIQMRHASELNDCDYGMLSLAARIAVGMCLRLSHGREDGASVRAKSTTKGPISLSGHIPKRDFIFSDDVSIDLTEEAREAGRLGWHHAREFKSRWLTRGHYRNQPCGPQSVERKRTWIRPHWKGRQEHPQRIRDHVIVEPTEE